MWNDSGRKFVNGRKFVEKRFIYNYLNEFLDKSHESAFFDTDKNNKFGMIGILLNERLIFVNGSGFVIL